MDKETLDQLMVDIASTDSINGGQPVFEFAWRIIDIVYNSGGEIVVVVPFRINEFCKTLVLAASFNKSLKAYLTLDGDEEEHSITVGYTMNSSPTRTYKIDSHNVLFSDLDQAAFLDKFIFDLNEAKIEFENSIAEI